MQTINAALRAEINKGQNDPVVLVDLYEFYESDYIPGVNGFDPADAIETFAAQTITWNLIEYRRELKSRGDILRNMGEKTNSVTLNFSNISRYMATLAENQQIEGLLLVVRCVAPSVEDDSLVLFVGRCDKPSDIDKGSFTLSARQDFGNINQTLPPNEFTSQDPSGRLPSDPLYEGFNFTAITGTVTFPTRQPSTSFFGRLFGRTKTVNVTEQWSSVDGTPWGRKIREIFGRCQVEGIPIAHIDSGFTVTALLAVCKGPILAIENIQNRTEGFTVAPGGIATHLGDAGGTGTNTGNTNYFNIGGGNKFSYLAYIEIAVNGSAPDATDEPPVITMLVHGRIVPLPNGDAEYVLEGWTDNPVHIARFILTHDRFVNIDPGFMEDEVNYLTALHCDESIIDETNDQLIVVHEDDYEAAGTDFYRYKSTGQITALSQKYNQLGDTSTNPNNLDGPYEPWNPLDPVPPMIPGATPTFIKQKLLRKRYTFNAPITDEVRAVDFLHKTVFPTFKGFLRVNKKGKYEIRSEVPADSTRIRASTAVGATAITVLDVTPWKTGPDLLTGRIRVGQISSTTSEVRDVSSADFSTSGNSITLTASSSAGIIATASGATLSGGSTSAQATGTVTFSGTPAAGNIVTVTIDGIAVVYTLDSDDTTSTVALMMKDWINATPRLQKYIRASWDSGSPTVVTIKCLHGALNLSSPLLKTHAGPVANPSSAPTLAAAASGSLDAGIYYVAYADVANGGLTALTAVGNVTLTAGQKINVSSLPAFPAGVTARWFYVSEETGSTNLRLHTVRADASNFSINSLPEPGASLPPSQNTTADELIRVAMSFATNSQDIYPAWPRSTVIVLNDVYLPTVLNGHKYQATSITTGLTAATEPTWPTTAGGTVVDNGVTWTEIGSTVLQQAGLSRSNVLKDSFSFPGGSKQSSVNQIKGNFRDAKNDFALTPFKVNDPVHQAQVKKIFPLELDLSAVDSAHQMERLANGALSKHREGDWFNTLATGPQGLVLEEGDVICSSDDAGGLVNVVTRIEELRIKPNHEVVINQARKYSTTMFSDDVGGHQIAIPSTLQLTRPRQVTDLTATRDLSGDWLITAVGHPRPPEIPAMYIARITNPADDSLLREIPIVMGARYAALMAESDVADGTLTIDNNDVTLTSGAAFGSALAYSIQQFTPDEQMLVEGVATVISGSGSPHSTVWIILADPASVSGFGYTPFLQLKIAYVDAQTVRVSCYDALYGGEGGSSESFAADFRTDGGIIYFAIGLSGTEVRFYAASSGSPLAAQDPPLFIGRTPYLPESNLVLATYLSTNHNGTASATDLTLSGFNRPHTIYALRQQQFDMGQDETGPGISAIDVEFWQVGRLASMPGFSAFLSALDARITEDGETRITEAGDTRIVE